MLTFFLYASIVHYADEKQELIRLAETGNSQLLSSLERFHCKFTTLFDEDITTKEEASYWRTGNQEKCEIASIIKGKKNSEEIMTATEKSTMILIRNYQSSNMTPQDAATITPETSLVRGNALRNSLIMFDTDHLGPVSLSKLLTFSKVNKCEYDGPLLLLDVQNKDYRFEIWLDPLKGFATPRLIQHAYLEDGTTNHWESKVKSFKEIRPGIYYPDVVEIDGYQKGKKSWWMKVSFIVAEIPKSIDPSTFKIKLTTGTTVINTVNSKAYKVAANGELLEQPGRVLHGMPLPTTGNAISETGPGMPWYFWISPLAFVLLLILLFVMYRNKRSSTPA